MKRVLQKQAKTHLAFKLSEMPQYPELRLPPFVVVAKVFWSEQIVLVLHGPNTEMRFPMTLLRQEQCTPAVSVLKDWRDLCVSLSVKQRARALVALAKRDAKGGAP